MKTGRHLALTAVLAVTLLISAGVTAPAYAWHYPSRATAKKIWKRALADTGLSTCDARTPRKGIRISDKVAKHKRWAMVDMGTTRCANGKLLYTSRLGTGKWKYARSLGSEFPGAPGSCSVAKDVPNRVLVDLTGYTCRGGRTTPTPVARVTERQSQMVSPA